MANSTSERLRRRRQSKACTRCRKRKIRCDFHYPACGACVAAAAECVGFDSIHGVEKPRSIISHLEDEVTRLEQQLHEARALAQTQNGVLSDNDRSVGAAYAAIDRVTTRLAAATVTPGSTATVTATDGIVGDATTTTTSGIGDGAPDKMLLPLTSSFFFVGSPAPYLNKPVAWDETRQAQGSTSPSASDKDRHTTSTTASAVPISSIPRHVAVAMLKHYCEIYRPQYPAVEEADLLAAFDRVYDNAQPTDFDVFCVHITLAISTTTLMYRDEGRAATATSGFWATAVAHLDGLDQPDQNQGGSNSSGAHAWQRVQALQLLAQYGFLNPKDVNCVRCAAAALRLCVQLGVHHELPLAQQAHVDPAVLDIRRRLFWHAYSIDIASNSTRGWPCIMTTDSITARMPHFGPASPTAHVWALRQMEAEIMRRLYYPTLSSTTLYSEPLTAEDLYVNSDPPTTALDVWQADIRARLAAWQQATRESVTLSEKLEFAEILYHMQRLRLSRPSPRIPAPTAAMRQECLAAAVAVLREFDVITRLGKLFYIWHAAHCVIEAAICLLALVLVGSETMCPSESTSGSEDNENTLSPSDVPTLTRHLKMFPGILWKIARRWPVVAHHASALEGIALAVVEKLQQWSGFSGPATTSITTADDTASLKQKLKDMSLFCPFPMDAHLLAAHEEEQRAKLGQPDFPGSLSMEVTDADITAPFDANWSLPPLSPAQAYPPFSSSSATVIDGNGNGNVNGSTFSGGTYDTVLDWDFAGVGFEEIFAALIQGNQDDSEGGLVVEEEGATNDMLSKLA